MKPAELRELILTEAKKNRPDLDEETIVTILDAMMSVIKTEEDVQVVIDHINNQPKK